MSGICEGRVVIITGAGRGIGRCHALEFAREGAKVVINDLGVQSDGSGSSQGPADEVAEEIESAVSFLLEQGEILTPDLGGSSSTEAVGNAVVAALDRN